jgi:hypothetical protein
MTKFLGQNTGQVIQSLQAGAPIGGVSSLYKDGTDRVLVRDQVVTAGNVIGDLVSLGTFRPTAYLDPFLSSFSYDALGTGVTLNIGDAAHPVAMRVAFPAATADQTLIMIVPTMPAALMVAAPLWQRLGYAAPPGAPIELLAFIAGANPVNGARLSWQIFGRNV